MTGRAPPRLVGAHAELWTDWRYHCFLTNRTVPTLVADIDHRDYATIELVDLDFNNQVLCYFPSSRFYANSAWTVIAALAHNLARWTTLIGLPTAPVQTVHSRLRHLLAIPTLPHQPLMDPTTSSSLAVEDRLHHRAGPIRALPAHLTASPRGPSAPSRPHADNGPLCLHKNAATRSCGMPIFLRAKRDVARFSSRRDPPSTAAARP